MAWSKNGVKTLSSNGTSIDVTGLSNNKFNVILSSMEANTSTLNPYSFINNETGTSYSTRYNINGTSESVQNGVNYGTYSGLATKANPYFVIDDLAVIGTAEKVGIRHVINQNTAGAGTAPDRAEVVYKVVNTADLSSFKWTGGDFSADDQVVVLGSDGAVTPAPNNVQDNSIFVEKDTANRFWFDAEVTNSITFEDDFSSSVGWSTATSNLNISSNRFNWSIPSGTTSSQVVRRDIGLIDTDKWVLRCMFEPTTATANSDGTSLLLNIGFSDSAVALTAVQDSITWQMDTSSSTVRMGINNIAGAGIYNGSIPVLDASITAKKYYIELSRDGSTMTGKSFTDAGFSVQNGVTQTKAIDANITGLRYLIITEWESDGSTNGAFAGIIDDIKFYNGVTVVTTPATWTCMGSTSSSEVSASSNVFLWLDAQDTCSITKDSSGKVSAWVNKIDDTDTLVQTTASKQPTYEPNGKSSGLPAVHFDGVDDFMELPAFTSGEATQPNQYFVVYKLVSTSSVAVFDKGNNAGGRNLLQDSSNNFNVHAGLSGIDGAITKDVFVLGTYLFNTTASTVRKNGAQQGSAVSCGTNGQNGFTLGSNSGGVDRITDIKVCEVIGISNSSATDRANIESYLNTKWSVY